MNKLFIGLWFLLSAFSAYFSIKIARIFVKRINSVHAATGFYVHFMTLGLFELITAILLIVSITNTTEGKVWPIALYILFNFMKSIGIVYVFNSFVEGMDNVALRKFLTIVYHVNDKVDN